MSLCKERQFPAPALMLECEVDEQRAILVGVDSGTPGFAESLEELRLLVRSAGWVPCFTILGKRSRPDPALFAGSGKIQEIRKALQEQAADFVVFNHSLSPAQERNLSKALDVPVVDRTRLILDIFGLRARSHEGKLQVEHVLKGKFNDHSLYNCCFSPPLFVRFNVNGP